MKRLLLVGLPNAGKSTIFSRLSKKQSHIGNWSGVTVSLNSASVWLGGEEMLLVDLPGIYGLSAYSREEKVTINEILKGDGIILNVIDCFELERSLNLTMQLIEIGCKVVVVLNFYEEFINKGGKINIDFGSPIIKSSNLVKLATAIFSVTQLRLNYLPIEIVNSQVNFDVKSRFNLLKAYEGDRASLTCLDHNLIATAKKNSTTLNLVNLYRKRKQFIKGITANCRFPKSYGLSKWDKFLLNPYFFSLIFLIMFGGMFWLAFGSVGESLKAGISSFFELGKTNLTLWLERAQAPRHVASFLNNVIFDGVGSVFSFLPQIVILFCGMELLQQSGLISRIVWLLKPISEKLGLEGRSIFALLLGFGCTTTAVPLTKAVKSYQTRIRTIFSLSFVPCSAKLPVISTVAFATFGSLGACVTFCVYALPLCVGLIFSLLINKKKTQFEFLELNPLRIPKMKVVLSAVWRQTCGFLQKIYKVILACACLIWFLCHFSLSGGYSEDISDDCVLVSIAKSIEWIFIPLGFSWPHVCALILGFPAKELSIVGLSMLNDGQILQFDAITCISFLTFFVLYTPCVSALKQIKINLPKKKFYLFVFGQLALSYLVASVVRLILLCLFRVGIKSIVWAFVLTMIVTTVLVLFLLNLQSNRKCKNCSHCGKC